MVFYNTIAVDVGANVGIVTRYLSQYFKTTHSIEPMPYLASRLKHLQNQRIKVHHCALGAEDGQITMRTPVGENGQLFHALSTASADNVLNMFAHQSIVECIVPQHRLSTLISQKSCKVGYVKIDVEGFEFAVLQGALELLNRDRPVIHYAARNEALSKVWKLRVISDFISAALAVAVLSRHSSIARWNSAKSL